MLGGGSIGGANGLSGQGRASAASANTVSNNPLDPIFDNVMKKYSGTSTFGAPTTSELQDQISSLQKQLAGRPSVDEWNRLKTELASLKAASSINSMGGGSGNAITPVFSVSPVLNLLPPPMPFAAPPIATLPASGENATSSLLAASSASGVNVAAVQLPSSSTLSPAVAVSETSKIGGREKLDEAAVIDMCVSVFNHLGLPGLGDFQPISKSTLHPFLASLLGILEKDASSSSNGGMRSR